MATVKEQVRRLLDTLSDDATLERTSSIRFTYASPPNGARQEAAEGQVLDEDETETRMQRWLDQE
mgnify:CR=1 FL=1